MDVERYVCLLGTILAEEGRPAVAAAQLLCALDTLREGYPTNKDAFSAETIRFLQRAVGIQAALEDAAALSEGLADVRVALEASEHLEALQECLDTIEGTAAAVRVRTAIRGHVR